MPEYLSPGVYIEEVSYRAKSIEALGTTTTGFVGPTRYGPVDIPLDVITSIGEFERSYGDRQMMQFDGPLTTNNYMWHAARAFFEQGGTLLYVSRVFIPLTAPVGGESPDGRAIYTIPSSGASIVIQARFPGDFGNMHVRITLQLGENVLAEDVTTKLPVARGLYDNDIVAVFQSSALSSPISSPLNAVFATAQSYFDTVSGAETWRFTPASGPPIELASLDPSTDPSLGDHIRVINATVTVYPNDPTISTWSYTDLALDRNHQTNGVSDSIEAQFAAQPDSLGAARTIPIVVTLTGTDTGLALLDALLQTESGLQSALLDPLSTALNRSVDVVLAEGNDGERPDASAYEGTADPAKTTKTGLMALEDIDEISIVAAPGSSYLYNDPSWRDESITIFGLLIAHAEKMRYRIAVLDSGDAQSISDVRALRAKLDSSYAALYYPWVTILDPVTNKEINLPPSGFVTGIYARNDINRAVYKAPANEVVTLAISFETLLNNAQQEVLNPLGINCFRYFPPDRGYRLWGARTISSDPDWRYVNVRRYFAYLEHSIDKGTQWAVFEPNGPLLWADVRQTISGFLLNEWRNGALLGDKPETSYFVRCDRSTMTQEDIDSGRMVCLVGVAALKPAEFVIFRIGQWTADSN
jgi:phage tail sheath protein FI